MAWPDDPLPPIRHELHFRGRLVACFAARPPSLYALLEATVARHPDGIALIDGATRITYRALLDQVERLSAGLAARGVGPWDRVALLLANRAEFLIALLGAARLGAITVPLSVREQTPGLHYMLENSGTKLLIYDGNLAERLPQPATLPGLRSWIALGAAPEAGARFEDLLEPSRDVPPPHAVDEDEVAVILYTSGTTGRPKGAMLTHMNIAHSLLHYQHCMGLGPAERSLLAVPATHVTGLIAILLVMVQVAGGTVLMRRFEARRFLELAAAERITHTVMVPAMYNLCLLEPDLAAFDLAAWRIGAYGGAPMPEATIARLAELLPNLQFMNAYGATETTSPTTLMPFGHTAGHAASVGRVVPCGEVRIMDEAGREVAPGAPGEVWIKGPMVVPGYWANNQATKAAFIGGYWRSGDIGALDNDGYLSVFDRLKDMINRAGYKVFSAEVENVLTGHPAVIEAAVVARPDAVLGEKSHAFVTLRTALDPGELRAFCAARLADYKVPDGFTLARAPLPRNANGKLQKALLRERATREAAG